ncbi:hypothetical protein QF027_006535 [Streptomyces canus]|nr:hypothetical protein [Streptomyces canus]
MRAGLAQACYTAYGPRGLSQLSRYAFAAEYARAHWSGRAAKTRDEVSDALTAISLAMHGDPPQQHGLGLSESGCAADLWTACSSWSWRCSAAAGGEQARRRSQHEPGRDEIQAKTVFGHRR